MAKLGNFIAQLSGRTVTTGAGFAEWEIRQIPVDDIEWVENVRSKTEEADIESMAASIKKNGLQTPVAVYLKKGKYCIKYGHRRYRAYQQLAKENPDQYSRIPCHIVNEGNILIDQLVENIQRENLSEKDLLKAVQKLRDENFSHKQIAAMIGKSEKYVDNIFTGINYLEKMPELNDAIKTAEHGVIGALNETAGIEDISKRKELIRKRVEGEIGRNALRTEVNLEKIKQNGLTVTTPAAGAKSVRNATLSINDKDKEIKLVLENSDPEYFPVFVGALKQFLSQQKIKINTTPAAGVQAKKRERLVKK